ncbi:vacuolar membrane-associated protein iml1 [Moniliophthora roreri MCA 2997]|uniref:Vacuolar membrane-associated protein IML1 n=2 Tax=Moniliophthora roreri TaxID=221103 RepID=V2X616_MONRO|nr:vacuolar membrane-associated protein iml1 [Moniliophthora roreri MCA 2997]
MSVVRSESQQQHYGRRRSNTAQSLLRPIPVVPLVYGDSTVLNSWVHDPKESPNVIFNHGYWPGVSEGDMLSVSAGARAFILMVPKDDGCSKPQLQISVPKPIAETFGIRNNSEVTVTKVEKTKYHADYVEVSFQDQYLGRNEMWRLGKHLVNQCVYTGQELSFIGTITAKIQDILVGGDKVPAALITPLTKIIYRSLSAKVTIFIQVCRELWEFAGDGERYNEKVVHSFLPALFSKWKEAGTNHTVTIVLISRVYYDQSEIEYASGPLKCDERGTWYKDFYKVITDLEVIHEWKPTLVSLKNSFWDFQRDILLTHHYHRASLDSAHGATEHIRLVGQLSYAHDGPILEALNLNLYPSETHYVDRSLVLTGASTILITPGTGYFRVPKQLLRLTTTRVLDQGFGLDLISLAKAPLHQSPIFSFQSSVPEGKLDKGGPYGSRVMDPLWGCDEDPTMPTTTKKTFWWEPFWVQMTFWDEQMDLPFRQHRFVPRAKMHEIQMLGLLDQDVLPSIEVPFLPPADGNQADPYGSPSESAAPLSKAEADQFDSATFSFQVEKPASVTQPASRNSIISSSASLTPSLRTLNAEKRASHRNSVISPNIERIEESPRHVIKDLPQEGDSILPPVSVKALSSSPSQASVLSNRSAKSSKSATSQLTAASVKRRSHSPSRSSLALKLTPAWLFKPFRSGPIEPQTTAISASASSSSNASSSSSVRDVSPKSKPIPAKGSPRSTLPLTIKNSTVAPSVLSRAAEDDAFHMTNGPNTGSISRAALMRRNSPMNTPPRGSGDIEAARRRSTNLSVGYSYPSSSESPSYLRANPSRPPTTDVSQPAHTHDGSGGLASRWQHIFPVPIPWHEMKWKAIVTPACLPLTVEYFPKAKELEREYDVYTYDFVVDPAEMKKSFMVNPPEEVKGMTPDARRRAWASVVMRGMAAVRLAQGFQFVIQPPQMDAADDTGAGEKEKVPFRRTQSFLAAEDETLTPKFRGAAEVLQSTTEPVYLSMSNEIHRISYTGEAIQVRRYVRRMPPTQPFEYQCLIWPKLGVGYTEQKITFNSHGLENYGWNRLDMLVAGYEHQFNESLRYWRTRFVVIPTTDPPTITIGPNGERLDEEEARILGIEKLAEQFTKLRWQPPEERSTAAPAVRFLPTTLSPVNSVTDDHLMEQLDQIHAAGPLKKKMKSEREIGGMSLMSIAKAMREEDGLPIKMHQWHRAQYADSFTGYDFVSWLVREFRDVSSRGQGVELGVKLMEEGLFEHVRGHHGFLDGHYFYRLKGEFAVASTPRRWFRARPSEDLVTRSGFYPGNAMRVMSASPRKNKKRLILSQTMVIDIDPMKRSDQAESVILHHDIIHNPSTVFHFELQWIGTTARFIEDQLRTWSKAIEKYGLKLVEAYVGQISDIRERNAFQSCFPVRLAVPPPIVPDLQHRVPEGTQTTRYFEYALLRRFGFIVDIEAADLYPENIDVVYSYRRSSYKYSQFVHRSGVAFVQVLGGSRGFLILTNRLMGPGRMGTTLKAKNYKPAVEAENIRTEIHRFCSDKQKLINFYDAELAELGHLPEEPPPLSI